jgi:hypothetical protein
MSPVATTLTQPSEGRAHAIAFLIDAYDGVRTAPGKGLPHAQAVADILRDDVSLAPSMCGDLAKSERLVRRGMSKKSRHAARRNGAPAAAMGRFRVSMCQVASVSLRASSI